MLTKWEKLEQDKMAIAENIKKLEIKLETINNSIEKSILEDDVNSDSLIIDKMDTHEQILINKEKIKNLNEIQDNIEHEHWQMKINELNEKTSQIKKEVEPFKTQYNKSKAKLTEIEKAYHAKADEAQIKLMTLTYEKVELENKLRNCKRYNQ